MEREQGQLSEAMEAISKAVMDGLKHGYFEYGLTCEIKNNDKRQLTLKAGKTTRYHIKKEELNQ